MGAARGARQVSSNPSSRGSVRYRQTLRFARRQVAPCAALFRSKPGTRYRVAAYDLFQEGGSCMRLGDEIRGHLPFLRSYARALTGSQPHGANFVHTLLDVVVADPRSEARRVG